MASRPTQGHANDFKSDARRPRGAGLLLFDLDDTLVQGGSYVSPRVLQALAAAREAGYVLCIASGRALCLVDGAILRSGVMDYGVCSNGATVTSLHDKTTLFHRALSQSEAMACHAMLSSFKPAWNAFIGEAAYFEWKGASYMLTGRTGAVARARKNARGRGVRAAISFARKGMRFALRLLRGGGHRQVRSIVPCLTKAKDGVDKMGCTIIDERACARAAELLEADGRFEVVRMGTTELEVTAKGVTKGDGASRLMEMLGIAPECSFAFGDSGNDLPLAHAVGCFVAMGNADDDVKEAADDVCPSVLDDGVAVWIESHLLTLE